MKARKPILLLFLVTVTSALLPELREIAAGWALDDTIATTTDAASDQAVATTAFAVG